MTLRLLSALLLLISFSPLARAGGEGTTLWEGSVPLSWDEVGGSVSISSTDILKGGIAEGDTIAVYYDAPASGGYVKLIYVASDGQWTEWPAFRSLPGVDSRYGTLYVDSPGCLMLPLDSEAVGVVSRSRAIMVQGQDVTVSRVVLFRSSLSGLSIPRTDCAEGAIYDLKGMRVAAPRHGILILRTGEGVKKVWR